MYVCGMKRLEAEERLQSMQAAAYPHMKKQDAERIVSKLRREASPELFEQKAITFEQLAGLING